MKILIPARVVPLLTALKYSFNFLLATLSAFDGLFLSEGCQFKRRDQMNTSAANPADIGISVLICIIAALGVIFNGFGLLIVMNNPILNNSFGKLCFSHCIANLGVCCVFLLWVSPNTIIQDESLSTSIFGKILGQINIFFWDVCVYSHLAISFNRLISIAFPIKAIYWITPLKTKLLIATPWFLGFFHIVPYFWYKDCYISYSPETWTWNFAATKCGDIISTYLDMYTGFTVFTLMAILDFTTLYFLHKNHQFVSDNTSQDRNMIEAIVMVKKRRNLEVKFFFQSLVQGGLFLYELSNFYIITTLGTDKYYVFFTSTFAWLLCHMLDGLVLTCFHVKGYSKQRSMSMHSSQRVFVRTSPSVQRVTRRQISTDSIVFSHKELHQVAVSLNQALTHTSL